MTSCPRRDAIETLPIPNVQPQDPREGESLLQHPLGSQDSSWLQCPALQVHSEPSVSFLGTAWQKPAPGRTQGPESHGRQVGRGELCSGMEPGSHSQGRSVWGGPGPAPLSRKALWLLGRRAKPCQAAPAAAVPVQQLLSCNCSLSHNFFFFSPTESSTVRELKSFQKPIKIS